MSACGNCGCSIPEVVNIPGLDGDQGEAGTNGINAFSLTTADITLPGGAGPVIGLSSFSTTAWMAVSQVIFISSDDTHAATFRVTSIASDTTAQLEWLDYPDDVGASIPSGATVSPSGQLAIAVPVSVANGGLGGASLAANTAGIPTQFVKSTFTLTGATPLTVPNAAITINSLIIISLNTVGGTVGAQPHVKTIGAGTMDVVGTAADTSVYNYMIIG